MLNMQTFYALLTKPFEKRDPYLDVMVALTKVDRAQMSALESDLAWQQWGEQTPDVASA
ncbi:MAG: hypothetical protein ABIF04_03050 [Chloroflexota bacterium]